MGTPEATARAVHTGDATVMNATSVPATLPCSRALHVLTLFAPLLACVVGGCKPRTNAFAPPPPPEVTVAHPVERPVTRYLEYTGTTEPYEAVELRARVAGFLDQVAFNPGAAVKKGDLLFVIDPRVYQAQAQQAEADVAARDATLRLNEITLQRVLEAAKSNAASKQEVDKATADRDQAKAQVELAKAALITARLNVEFTQVRSPIDGRITKNLVDPGNLVGAAGQPTVLATVVSDRPLYVSVDASESDLLMVRRARLASSPGAEPGQIAPGVWRPVDIATAESEEFNVHGRIDYVDPALNPQTGTIRVRARFENETDVLIPGIFVRLRIFLDTTDAMVAPDIALLSDQSGRYALVVNDKDTVEIRRVKIGALDGSLRVVLDGLSTSDRIIVNGLQRARPGVVVKPTLQEIEPPRAPSTPSPPPVAPPTNQPAGAAPSPGAPDRGNAPPAEGPHV
jgi:RND family efflux transporter MFP subunit